MKERAGYVSNSSSSSFCMFCASVETSELMDKMLSSSTDDVQEKFWELKDELRTLLNDRAKGTGITIEIDGEGSYTYLGMGPDSIKDDETGGLLAFY